MSSSDRIKSVALFFVVLSVLSLCTCKVQSASIIEDSWTSLEPMPTSRSGLGVTVVSGKIYAIGGDGGSNATEEYNPVTGTWTVKKQMPTGRSRFGISVYQNKIYVIGGATPDGFTAANEVYDPLTDTWEIKSPLPKGGRAELSASVINGEIYVVGGYFFGGYYVSSNALEVYDPETDTWTTKSPMPTAVYSCSSAVIDNKMYVIENSFGNKFGRLNQVYNAENDSWSYGSSIPVAVTGASAAATTAIFAPKKIYVMGVNEYSNSSNQIYQPEDDTWSNGTQLPNTRSYLGLVAVSDILYAIGGSDRNSVAANLNEQYTPLGYGTVPPVLILNSPRNTIYNVTSIPIAFTTTKTIDWSGYSIDGLINMTIIDDILLTDLSEGNHTLIVYANDTLGNMGISNTVHFSIDTVQPVLVILSPKSKVYDSNEIQLNFTTNEPVSWLTYNLDEEGNVTISKNLTLAGLTDGAHNLIVYAADSVGNIGFSETVSFNVEPFPVILVAASTTSTIIVILAGYLFFKRRRTVA